MSVSHYQHLRDRAERREAVEEALASVRAEGLEPSALGHRLLSEVALGRISTDEMRRQLTEHYTR
ncbi:antitoxin VbhA family protein [Pseudonocardia petroleophila]